MNVINCLAHTDSWSTNVYLPKKEIAKPTIIDLDSIDIIHERPGEFRCIHVYIKGQGFYIFGDKACDYIKDYFTKNCVDLTK